MRFKQWDVVQFVNLRTNRIAYGVVRGPSGKGWLTLEAVKQADEEWSKPLGSIDMASCEPVGDPAVWASYAAWRLTQ